MTLIALGFRQHLKQSDLDFIIGCLSQSDAEAEALLHLLTDPNSVDLILDHPELFETVLGSVEQLPLSTRLYFYLLTRHSLKNSGLDDPDLADYVSGVLEHFVNRQPGNDTHRPVFYFVDWLKQLETSPPDQHFELYVMAGNQLLFLTGVFPQYLAERSRRRGAPDIAFYEDVGRHSFQSAATHPMSHRMETHAIYKEIAKSFSELRYVLNDVSERLVNFDRPSGFGFGPS